MRRSAFTLLELLLALVLSALVLAALAPALFGVIRGQRQADRILAPLAERQAAMTQLREDLHAVLCAGTLAVPFTLAATAGDTGQRPELTCFVTTPPPLPPSWATRPPAVGQAVITWALQPARDGRSLALARSAQVHLLATGTPPDPVPDVLIDGLASAEIDVLVGGTWYATYDSGTGTDAIRPAAVRIRLHPVTGPSQVWCFDLPQAAGDGT